MVIIAALAFATIYTLIILHPCIYRQSTIIFGKQNESYYLFPVNFYPCIAVLVEFRSTNKIISVVHTLIIIFHQHGLYKYFMVKKVKILLKIQLSHH